MITMKKFHIVDIGSDGQETILLPVTDADYILTGKTYKVPSIFDIDNWTRKATEVSNARGTYSSLSDRFKGIDDSLKANSLLNTIKGVDGSGSGLDADMIDGKNVNDSDTTSSSIWTAEKVRTELDKKVGNDSVVSVASPNKILKLNSNSRLSVDVEGNSTTATALKNAVSYTLSGDVSGSFTVKGGEGTQSIKVDVLEDSHNHTVFTKGANAIEMSVSDIALFKRDGAIVSKINSEGKFIGDASSVGTYSVNDSTLAKALWTNERIIEEIGKVVSLDESKGSIKLNDLIKINYGKIDVSGKSEITITFKDVFAGKILFDNCILETADSTLICRKKPNSETNSSVTYSLNKSATSAKLIWFAVGI